MMEQKRSAVVAAARRSFLDNGYSQTSMDAIAALAEVSVKTIYRHFENKDELFSAVMQAVCRDNGVSSGDDDAATFSHRYPWFDDASIEGLSAGGREYLDYVLSEEQLSLYRVVIGDAHRFPELGRRYQREVVNTRTGIFVRYLDHFARVNNWKLRDTTKAGAVFEALLRGGFFEEVLHGVRNVGTKEKIAHARSVAKLMWKLLQAEIL
ncbi:Transcriptional regulator, TetR family [Acidisarcina polymorpha]|uniref:Transcriptional regulator, TetR family n=2 Tax=Acidisarcina polymorpha TaxID=2211140 RepID=A0A2Z5FTR9_9BACT|nr:Transcriptional regulator, TetR family [Acidisarcina polymorpha]